METCKHCNTELTKDEAIYTDYFQVHGENAPVYTLCGPCYLKEVDKYLTEEAPKCECGAPEVKFHDDEETIDMAISEGILNLICSEAKKSLDTEAATLEELENEGVHTVDLMLYIKDVADEDLIIG